jgi:hypothetical protein
VKEFQGRFHDFMLGQEKMMRFDFTFGFRHGPVKVEIYFLRRGLIGEFSPDERIARIIVKRVSN